MLPSYPFPKHPTLPRNPKPHLQNTQKNPKSQDQNLQINPQTQQQTIQKNHITISLPTYIPNYTLKPHQPQTHNRTNTQEHEYDRDGNVENDHGNDPHIPGMTAKDHIARVVHDQDSKEEFEIQKDSISRKEWKQGTQKQGAMMEHDSIVLYFENFPFRWNARSLTDCFKKYFPIDHIYVPRKLSKRGRKFGFIKLQSKDGPSMLSFLKGLWIGQHKIHATVARFQRTKITGNDKQKSITGDGLHENTRREHKKINAATHDGRSYKEVVSTEVGTVKEFIGDDCNLELLERSAIARVLNIDTIGALHHFIAAEGMMPFTLRPLGGDQMLLSFDDRDTMLDFVHLYSDWLNSWFWDIKPWDKEPLMGDKRLVWYKIMGVPIQLWCTKFWKWLCNSLGTFVRCHHLTEKRVRLDMGRMLVLIDGCSPSNSSIPFRYKGHKFTAEIREDNQLDSLAEYNTRPAPKTSPNSSLSLYSDDSSDCFGQNRNEGETEQVANGLKLGETNCTKAGDSVSSDHNQGMTTETDNKKVRSTDTELLGAAGIGDSDSKAKMATGLQRERTTCTAVGALTDIVSEHVVCSVQGAKEVRECIAAGVVANFDKDHMATSPRENREVSGKKKDPNAADLYCMKSGVVGSESQTILREELGSGASSHNQGIHVQNLSSNMQDVHLDVMENGEQVGTSSIIEYRRRSNRLAMKKNKKHDMALVPSLRFVKAKECEQKSQNTHCPSSSEIERMSLEFTSENTAVVDEVRCTREVADAIGIVFNGYNEEVTNAISKQVEKEITLWEADK